MAYVDVLLTFFIGMIAGGYACRVIGKLGNEKEYKEMLEVEFEKNNALSRENENLLKEHRALVKQVQRSKEIELRARRRYQELRSQLSDKF